MSSQKEHIICLKCRVSTLAEADFPLRSAAPTPITVPPPFYTAGTGGSFHGSKAAGVWSWPHAFIRCWEDCMELHLYSPIHRLAVVMNEADAQLYSLTLRGRTVNRRIRRVICISGRKNVFHAEYVFETSVCIVVGNFFRFGRTKLCYN